MHVVGCTKTSRSGSKNATRIMTWISILVSHTHTCRYKQARACTRSNTCTHTLFATLSLPRTHIRRHTCTYACARTNTSVCVRTNTHVYGYYRSSRIDDHQNRRHDDETIEKRRMEETTTQTYETYIYPSFYPKRDPSR